MHDRDRTPSDPAAPPAIGDLSPSDAAHAWATGREPRHLRQQIALLRGSSPRLDLVRPCTPGDGIRTLPPDTWSDLELAAIEAADNGRLSVFLPASGLPAELVEDLRASRDDLPARPVLEVLTEPARDQLRLTLDLPLWDEILDGRGHETRATLERLSAHELLEAVLTFARHRPIGLVPVHRDHTGTRTPLMEHLVEAAELVTDAVGRCRLVVTVARQHLVDFEQHVQATLARLEGRERIRYEVRFSVQDPFTDTPAVHPDGSLVRDAHGQLVYLPGGHGALVKNLATSGGDLVLVRNIDNVHCEALRDEAYAWRRRLVGCLVDLQQTIHELQWSLEGSSDDLERAREVLKAELGVEIEPTDPGTLRDRVREALGRPLRVCAMVQDTARSGGRPFWVRDRDGLVSRQIVETSQVPEHGRDQFDQSSWFNPVDMVVAIRDHHDAPIPLHRFVDRTAYHLVRRTYGEEPVTALEYPGLWNGGMAGWNTVFVDVPAEVFRPTKSLEDLVSRVDQGG